MRTRTMSSSIAAAPQATTPALPIVDSHHPQVPEAIAQTNSEYPLRARAHSSTQASRSPPIARHRDTDFPPPKRQRSHSVPRLAGRRGNPHPFFIRERTTSLNTDCPPQRGGREDGSVPLPVSPVPTREQSVPTSPRLLSEKMGGKPGVRNPDHPGEYPNTAAGNLCDQSPQCDGRREGSPPSVEPSMQPREQPEQPSFNLHSEVRDGEPGVPEPNDSPQCTGERKHLCTAPEESPDRTPQSGSCSVITPVAEAHSPGQSVQASITLLSERLDGAPSQSSRDRLDDPRDGRTHLAYIGNPRPEHSPQSEGYDDGLLPISRMSVQPQRQSMESPLLLRREKSDDQHDPSGGERPNQGASSGAQCNDTATPTSDRSHQSDEWNAGSEPVPSRVPSKDPEVSSIPSLLSERGDGTSNLSEMNHRSPAS